MALFFYCFFCRRFCFYVSDGLLATIARKLDFPIRLPFRSNLFTFCHRVGIRKPGTGIKGIQAQPHTKFHLNAISINHRCQPQARLSPLGQKRPYRNFSQFLIAA